MYVDVDYNLLAYNTINGSGLNTFICQFENINSYEL